MKQKRVANGFRSVRLGAPALLALAGIGLGVGYSLGLAGFAGWMTLALAGASLLAGGALWRDQSRFWIPAVVVVIEGAILCTMALPDQLGNGAFIAAVANLAIIVTLITVAAVILRQPK
jgi:hypothetical protein